MRDESWLANPPVKALVDDLVDRALGQYRIGRPAAERLVREVLAADQGLERAAAAETSPERLKRSRAFKRAASEAKRRVYYHLRTYEIDRSELESLVARLGKLGPEADARQRDALSLEVARCHKSTAERLPSLDRFHQWLFSSVGTLRRVLDVGCGLYPLVFPFDEGGRDVVQYLAADRHPSVVSAVEAYAAARGDGRIVARQWDVRSGWDDLLPPASTTELDVALLLKLVPVLRRQARELLDVLRQTPARIWVASGSRISMTKRRSIERRERAVLDKFAASAGRRVEAELVTEDEFAWVLA
jgi:16S rRNA (guanine(1405)-N(7))-methyltransferase